MEDFSLDTVTPNDDMDIEEIMEYMQKMNMRMANTVKKLYHRAGQDKQRSSHKDGWSPTFIFYKSHLTALVMIRRHITGQKGRKRWRDAADMKTDLELILADWDNKTIGLDLSDEQKSTINNSIARNRTWWSEVASLPALFDIDADMKRIKLLLHGANRREYRRRINAHVRAREDKRKEGKWGHVLNSVLGTLRGRKGQDQTDLNTVKSKAGVMSEDAAAAHKMITEEFQESFYGKPVWCKGALHEGEGWQECLESEDKFLEETNYTNVPLEFRKLLYAAISKVPHRDKIEEDMAEALRVPPSLEEFEEGIKRAKVNSSAGMNGVSYNMLKKLPGKLVKSLHYCLTRLWNKEDVPDWWTKRWIVPIQKKEQVITSVDNLRPLILVDSVRKIWSKLILKRILRIWRAKDILQHNQHGFTAGKNTMTASLMFINAIEEAVEKDEAIHISSWDITRAFDSVSKNIMRLAWARLGVPTPWVNWLVGLDEKGVSVVRTPHAIKAWDKRNMKRVKFQKEMSEDIDGDVEESVMDGFVAERGTGQGDVLSPSCWGAIFDILLTMLDLDAKDRESRWTRGSSNSRYRVKETAYADDLLSYANSTQELQRKADIVSAFCLVMGLQISTSKLRRFVLVHSGLEAGGNNCTTIHHNDWISEEIPVQQDGSLVYLGGMRDLDGSTKQALEEMEDIALKHCAEVQICAASAQTKVGIVDISTYGKLRYQGKLIEPTLIELRRLDKVFHKFHARATKQMASFPYDLLYLSPKYGGGGLKQFSDINSIDKLAEIFRGYRRRDEVKEATEGMLQRILAARNLEMHKEFKVRFDPVKGKRHWLRSSLEWLQKHNLYLWRGGVQAGEQWLSCPLELAFPHIPNNILKRLRARRIIHVGDIIDEGHGFREWRNPSGIKLDEYLPITPTNDDNMIIWEGQFWKPYRQTRLLKLTDVVEIVRVEGEQLVHIDIWNMTERTESCEWYKKRSGTIVTCMTELFQQSRATRVDQEGYRKSTQKCKFINERTIPTPRIKLQLQQEQPAWVHEANEFVRRQPRDYKPRIYTDGSYKEIDHDLHSVFEDEAVRKVARAGIVILHDGPEWKTRPIFALHIKEGEEIGARSAYTMEYLAIAAAQRLQKDFKASAVCSDSLAVVKTIRNRDMSLKQAGGNHRVLLQAIDSGIVNGKVTPHWIRSHAERRKKDKTSWSMDE